MAGNRIRLALAALIGVGLGAGGALAVARLLPGLAAAPAPGLSARAVKAYLVRHPQVLIEAAQAYQARGAAQAVASNRAAITKAFGNAWAGNPQGDVTIVEYFDYNCGYCRANLPAIDALLAADPKVRIVFRELPILSRESYAAAQLSLVAAQRGRFHQFHKALYGTGPISDAGLDAALKAAGITPAEAEAAARAPGIEAEIARNLEMMKQLNLRGTPSWVVGDQVISSALTLDQLQALVAEVRAGG